MTPPPVARRTVLRGALLGSLAGCTATRSTALAPRTHSSATTVHSSPPATSGSAPTASGSAPTESAWRALAGGLDGDLVRPGDADYADAKELFNPRWDAVQPLAVVEAATSHDVSEAIRFAVRYGLNVRPKSGGHSYVGASTSRGGIVVSTSRMTRVEYDAASSTATVDAGARLYPVHSALAASGRTIPTGTCPTVGAAGLTLGGGVGIASRAYGLTCDQLYAARIVTADGVARAVDESTNPELLWALRGGGGGNFGVVTQLQYHTQPAAAMGFFLLSFPWSSAAAVVRGWSSRIKVMPADAWANLHLEAGSDGSTQARIVGVCAAGAETAEAQAMEAAIGVGASSSSLLTKTYLDGVQFLGGGTTSPRQGWAAGSDVLPSMTVPASRALVRVIADRAATGNAGVAILDPLTGAVQQTAPAASAFPWRRHLCSIQWYLDLPSRPTSAQVRAAYDWIASGHASVGSLSSGGYVNYLEPRRRVSSYYAGNLARLQSVKHTYDPRGFFSSPYAIPT